MPSVPTAMPSLLALVLYSIGVPRRRGFVRHLHGEVEQ